MNTALLAPLLELFELEEQMRKASIFDELIIHYQPQVDLKYGSLVGTEALLRWGHPKFGLIPPGKFIPVAERTGLIRPIGTWVLREVCRQAATWQRAGYPPIMVGVNVSAEQFAEPDFVQTVIKILRENNLEPRWLELELTESLMLSDFEMTARHLSDLKQLGVSIALDDFGVGHAVLSHLQRLPIDNLKIDRSFISDVALLSDEQSQHSIDLIQTILTLARKLRMRTVIEGIETQAQADLARHLNGDWAQGFWFGRPMPVQQFEQLFQHTLETRHTEPVD
jgi:EAL domain-containing protein (putative c-di-GMP-specific phosphodiesterase class I)